MERKLVLAFVLGLFIVGVPLTAQSYVLSRQLSGLENQIGLINQEIDAIWEEINMLKVGNSTNDTMNFTFTWGPDTQRIVQGTLRLEISLKWVVVPNSTHKWLSMVVRVNDDDYSEGDYLGLVFDMNENGVMDLWNADGPCGLWTNNMTTTSVLLENGFLGFAEEMPTRGPHNCTFDSETGYTFQINFSSLPSDPWSVCNPAEVLREGYENPLHICFVDSSGEGVFVRFVFLAHA